MFKKVFLLVFIGLILVIPEISYIEKLWLVVPTIILVGFIDFFILKKIEFYTILTIGITLSMSLIILYLISQIYFNMETSALKFEEKWNNAIVLTLGCLCLYFSFRVGTYTDYFRKKKNETTIEQKYLVDTCAIIDGRLLEIAKSGFIPKNLAIPSFVIHELQLISDSSNHDKRSKGRRGLDLLKHMKNSDCLSIQIINDDVEEIKTVDSKLLAIAKEKQYKIITTDFNLTKVAQLQGVQSLNINHLASLIKPSLNIGDRTRVFISKKGNNSGQGLAFLPDDTMVVVEDAEKYIGSQKQVMITSYIQNESGRMAFAKLV